MSRLSSYLEDPVLKDMYAMIRGAGPIRPISLDITAKCNLRCTGCYYYAEGMDRVDARRDDEAFDALIESEKARGTNFVTIVGGEPALVPDRLVSSAKSWLCHSNVDRRARILPWGAAAEIPKISPVMPTKPSTGAS